MQFAKSKRFIEPVNDAPPPGTYNMPVPLMSDQSYKRGPMHERADRFTEKSAGPDTFGSYDPDAALKENKRPRASSAMGGERVRQQMEDMKHRLQTQHDKDLDKLQSKIARLELSRDEAVKDKSENTNEILGLKAVIRSLTSNLTSTTSKLAKAEASLAKHTSLLPQLQSKLETLSASHVDSRKRKDIEIDDLRTILAAREDELTTTKEESRHWRSQARAEARARAREVEVASSMIESLRLEIASVRVADLHTARLRILRLERQLADRTAQVKALGEYSGQVNDEADFLRDELRSAEVDRDWMREAWKAERADRRSEKEWRQRTRSDQREILGLREDVTFLSDFRTAERVVDGAAEWVAEERRRALEADKSSLEEELEVAEGELDLAVNEEIPRLEGQLDNSQKHASELQERSDDLQQQLKVAEEGIHELQTRSVEDHERFEGEMEEVTRKLTEKGKEAEKERSEKKRVAGLLGQSRAAQDGLREELDVALAELVRMQEVSSQHKDLCRTLDHLARQNAATEEDNRVLADQNTELISHGNPHQKIRHVAQIREELAESKRKHLATTSVLASTESENAALRAELDAYRSVSTLPTSLARSAGHMGPPATVPARSRVSRPILDDVYLPTASTAASASSVPQFVISEEPQPYNRDDDRLFASNSRKSFGLSASNGSSAGSRRPGRAMDGLQDQELSKDQGGRPRPSGGVRMSGVLRLEDLL